MQVFNAKGRADFSWTIIDLRIWGVVENLVGISAASVPTLKPLFVAARTSQYYPWSKTSSGKGYVAHSDDTPAQRRVPADPYALTLGTATGAPEKEGVYPQSPAYGSHGDRLGGRINVQTDIELDDYHDQRPMVRKAEPVYHGV